MAENSAHPESCMAENSAQSYNSEPSLSQSGGNPRTSTPVSGNLLSHTSFLSKVLAGQANILPERKDRTQAVGQEQCR